VTLTRESGLRFNRTIEDESFLVPADFVERPRLLALRPPVRFVRNQLVKLGLAVLKAGNVAALWAAKEAGIAFRRGQTAVKNLVVDTVLTRNLAFGSHVSSPAIPVPVFRHTPRRTDMIRRPQSSARQLPEGIAFVRYTHSFGTGEQTAPTAVSFDDSSSRAGEPVYEALVRDLVRHPVTFDPAALPVPASHSVDSPGLGL
jgi:hypothetical protein